MKLPITIDPRFHDAVLFDLDGALTNNVPLFGATVDLARKLQGVGVATAAYSSSPQCRQALKDAGIDDLFGVCIDGIAGERGSAEKPDPTVLLEATRRLGARPQRCVVVENSAAGVAAGRDGGFALVVGIDGTGRADDLTRRGADVVLADLADVAVRTGDTRISELPNALDVLWPVDRHHQRTRVDVVPRLRRNAVSHRLRSRRGHARRRRRGSSEARRRGVPRGHPERSRPRGHPQPGGHTRHLVRGQPRLRADRTGRHPPPERSRRRVRTHPRARRRRIEPKLGGHSGSTRRAQAFCRRGALPRGGARAGR